MIRIHKNKVRMDHEVSRIEQKISEFNRYLHFEMTTKDINDGIFLVSQPLVYFSAKLPTQNPEQVSWKDAHNEVL